MVRGSVTEFEQRAGAGGVRLGVGLPVGVGTIGGNTATGHVGIDVRLVDTTSGQIIQSFRAEAKTTERSLTGDVAVRNVSFGGDAFEKTPLGLATREAIFRAVTQIVERMDRVPWTGRVVDVTDRGLFVNAGRDASLKPGLVLTISSVTKELTDPATGMRLGVVEQPLGEVELVTVQEKFAVGRYLQPFDAKRGDLVRLK